ncbi:cytochrome P450 [Sorangium sp. So ce1389]|uniref:cytochrome P450 n=1 Tax=Sorangium sp. So ce1389 TaxID=3133336 RepID=UPI003F62CEB7
METVRAEVAPAGGARDLATLPGPRRLPFLGNILEIRPTQFHLTLEDWSRKYGDLYTFWMGRTPIVVVSNLELVQRILRERPKEFRRWSPLQEIIEEIGFDGVFSAEGDQWTRQRRLVMSAFTAAQLRESHGMLATITRRLRERWRAAAARGEPVDARRDLARYTVDVTTAVAFGMDTNLIERGADPLSRQLETIFAAVNRRIFAPFPYWRHVKLPADRALDQALSAVRQRMLDMLRTARAELDRDPGRAAAPRSLLEAMLVARDAEDAKARLSDQEVLGNVLTVLLAGEDTTADTMAWMLHFMALRPDVQARMRAEADAELGDADLPGTPEHAQRLRYIGAVAHETLRLRSAAPLLFIEACAETVLGPLRLGAGARMILLTRQLGLKDESFHDASSFLPERWLTPRPTGAGKHDPRAALAFGSGPRVCPGRALSLLESAMVGAMVARDLDVSLVDPAQPVKELLGFTMKPEGLMVRFTARRR